MKTNIIILFVVFSSIIYPADSTAFVLTEGDLLFQDVDCGPLCDAIEKVTKGVNGANFSHIGMAVKDSSNNIMILEAVGEGVKLTAPDKFLRRSSDKDGNPKVVVGRLKGEYKHLIPQIISEAQTYLNKPYDKEYRFDNKSYYCSELIYLAAFKANDEEPLFLLQPMTFKDPDTGEFYPAWVEYYQELNIKIPEEEPGINPGGISLSDKIEIVHIYGYPEGWRE